MQDRVLAAAPRTAQERWTLTNILATFADDILRNPNSFVAGKLVGRIDNDDPYSRAINRIDRLFGLLFGERSPALEILAGCTPDR